MGQLSPPLCKSSTDMFKSYPRKHLQSRSGHKQLVCTTSQRALLVQEAEEQLDEGQVGFIPEASAMTHKQVLEMAVAEASRRVHEATKYAHCTRLVRLHQGITQFGVHRSRMHMMLSVMYCITPEQSCHRLLTLVNFLKQDTRHSYAWLYRV